MYLTDGVMLLDEFTIIYFELNRSTVQQSLTNSMNVNMMKESLLGHLLPIKSKEDWAKLRLNHIVCLSGNFIIWMMMINIIQ